MKFHASAKRGLSAAAMDGRASRRAIPASGGDPVTKREPLETHGKKRLDSAIAEIRLLEARDSHRAARHATLAAIVIGEYA
jgi:hypothetical protein